MADKDFRKLKRWELIEIIVGLQKDLQETTEENDGNKDKRRSSIFSVHSEYCLWWQQFQY